MFGLLLPSPSVVCVLESLKMRNSVLLTFVFFPSHSVLEVLHTTVLSFLGPSGIPSFNVLFYIRLEYDMHSCFSLGSLFLRAWHHAILRIMISRIRMSIFMSYL